MSSTEITFEELAKLFNRKSPFYYKCQKDIEFYDKRVTNNAEFYIGKLPCNKNFVYSSYKMYLGKYIPEKDVVLINFFND